VGDKPNRNELNRLKLIQSEARQAKVIRLYLQGNRVHRIAKMMGISDRTVLRDIDRARQAWKERTGRTYEDKLPEKLAEIEHIKRAAWVGWRKSLKDDEEVTETTSPEGVTVRRRRRGQSGNAAYLNTLAKLVETECQLTGLLDPKPSQEQTIPVVEVVVTTRQEKQEFETLTTSQFKKIAETPG
jgi:transposase